jgi:acetyltransferase-like isoleucine patch superfamily enzyme
MATKGEFGGNGRHGSRPGKFVSSARISELLGELRALLEYRHALVDLSYDRSLPFGDYIVDRWDKARSLGFGEGSSIYDNSLVFGKVSVGKNTWIGPFSVLDGSGVLKVGDNCTISAGAKIYTHDIEHWTVYGRDVDLEPELAEVTIGDGCFIGPNAVIKAGVVIGHGAIIEANSVVDKNVAPKNRYR